MSRKTSSFQKLADDFMSSSSSPSKNARLSFLCLLLFLPSNQKSIHIEYMSREAPNPESFLELFDKQLLLTSKSAHILPSHPTSYFTKNRYWRNSCLLLSLPLNQNTYELGPCSRLPRAWKCEVGDRTTLWWALGEPLCEKRKEMLVDFV
jgi:hypothetical protein